MVACGWPATHVASLEGRPATGPMRRMCTAIPMSGASCRGHDGHANQMKEGNVAASPSTHELHVPLDSDDRPVSRDLQGMLVDLVDLALIGKQAHWNVEGPQFRSVHLFLDELVDSWRAFADQVAERAVASGAAPYGQAETVAGTSEIVPLPAGALSDMAVIDAIASRLAGVVARTRERIAHTAESDPVSEDLLIALAGTLEKQLWMLRAHGGPRP
jgi:starvation-inducible DNA-binding protein